MQEDKRKLGLRDTMSLAIGTMIAAGIFVLPGIAIEKTGYGIIWAFILAAFISFFSAMSYAELAASYPKDGGGYMFSYEAFGSFWGFITGWSTWLGHTAAAAFCIQGFSVYFNNFIFNTGSNLRLSIGLTILLSLLNILGTTKVVSVTYLLNIGKIILLMIFIGFGFTKGSVENVTILSTKGFGPLVATIALLYPTYFGYSVATNVGSEVKNPGKVIPKTIIYSMILVTIIYVLVAISILSSGITVFNESSVGEAAIRLMGHGGGVLIALGAIFAALSAANANLISAAKISTSMAEEDQLNKRLAVKNKRFETPHRAILLNLLIVLLVLTLGDIRKIITTATFIALLSMVLVNLAVIKLRRKHPHLSREFKVPFYPFTPILGAVTSLILMFVLPPGAIILGLGFTVMGLLFYQARRTPVEKISRFVREHVGNIIHRF
ncbi:MAG: APC family permease [Candidatus Gracilibacteria bacterium]|nr:APC family permease [Candidatus Gracilibacteria bacterium]